MRQSQNKTVLHWYQYNATSQTLITVIWTPLSDFAFNYFDPLLIVMTDTICD